MFVARRAGGWADTAVAAATSTRARYLITLVGAAVKSCYRRLKVAALFFVLARRLHFFMLVGPHPHSLSLGGPASPGFPPAPRSGRRRYIIFFCAARPSTSARAENNSPPARVPDVPSWMNGTSPWTAPSAS